MESHEQVVEYMMKEYVLHSLMRWHRLTRQALHRLLTATNENGVSLGFDGLAMNDRKQTLLMKLNSWQYAKCRGSLDDDITVIKRLREIYQQVGELVEYLIVEVGIDVNTQDINGKTAIMYAIGQILDRKLTIFGTYDGPEDPDYDQEAEYDKCPLLQLVVLRVLYKYSGRLDLCDAVGKTVMDHHPWIKRMFVGSTATISKPLPFGGCEEEWKEQDERFFGMCMSLDWTKVSSVQDESMEMNIWNNRCDVMDPAVVSSRKRSLNDI